MRIMRICKHAVHLNAERLFRDVHCSDPVSEQFTQNNGFYTLIDFFKFK